MKISAAALLVLACSPASQAFVPRGLETRSRSLRSTTFRRSTTEDEIQIVTHSLRNSVAASDVDGIAKSVNKNRRTSDVELAKVLAIETRAAVAAYVSQFKGQSGASIVYSKLVENGVTVVNGYSGGAVLPLLDQFHEGHPRHKTSNKTPIRWITNSNESSAGHIAEGYAKSMPLGGEHLPVGVVICTSGPGLTNLITPLQDAICDGVPVVAICGQAATNAPPDAFQSAPAVELTRPCTKWSYQIKSAAEIPMAIDYAFYVARNGRPGPVFIDLPKDLQNQILSSELIDAFVNKNLFEEQQPNSFVRLQEKRRPNGDAVCALSMGTDKKMLPFEIFKAGDEGYKLKAFKDAPAVNDYEADHLPTNRIMKRERSNKGESPQISEGDVTANDKLMKEIIDLATKARKPVILVGQGCNDSPEELKQFAEKLQIPVATTLHALGCFDERNNLALNMVGMHGHPTPNFMFQECDLVISVGSRFDDRITGRMKDYLPEARKAAEEGRGGIVHCDIRRTENAKQLAPTYFVHSTCKKFLQTLNEGLSSLDIKPQTSAWLNRMKTLQRDFPVKIPAFRTQQVTVTDEDGKTTTISKTRMSAQKVVANLNRQLLEANLMDDTLFTTGVGVHQMIAAQLITWTQPRQMLSSGSLGTMGVALGYSIGAKLANGKKIVIAVDGDGSFNMTFTELKSLMEHKIPVKIMILDNDGQMMVEYWQRLFHDNRLLAVRNSHNPDYVMLAKAFGIKALYVDSEEELEDKMRQFLFDDPNEPVVFHVRVERTPCLPLVAPGQPLDDMILEDIEVNVDGSAAPS